MSINLDAIQARADNATEGPWFFDAEKWLEGSARDGYYVASPGEYSTDEVQVLEIRDGDAHFIANARTDVPALIAYARELEARVGRVEAIADISMDSEHGDLAFISGWQAALEEVQARLTEATEE